jgi:hypothetical protein
MKQKQIYDWYSSNNKNIFTESDEINETDEIDEDIIENFIIFIWTIQSYSQYQYE